MEIFINVVAAVAVLFGIGVFFAPGPNNIVAGLIAIGTGILTYEKETLVPVIIGFIFLWIMRIAGLENKVLSVSRSAPDTRGIPSPLTDLQAKPEAQVKPTTQTQDDKSLPPTDSLKRNLGIEASAVLETEADQWELALDEYENKTYPRGLWAQCYAEADGDETKTKVLFLRARATQLQAQLTDVPVAEQEAPQKDDVEPSLPEEPSLKNPIHVHAYMMKYKVSEAKLRQAIVEGNIRSELIDDVLWLEDYPLPGSRPKLRMKPWL